MLTRPRAALGVAGVLVVGVAALVASSMRDEATDPRRRPHSYYTEVSVKIARPVDEVYEFVTCRLPETYTELSPVHERFDVQNADGLVEGAEVVCRERGPREVVHHRYVVTRAVENELLQFESTPSLVHDRATGRVVGTCNTAVYFDFEALGDERTRLSQTIVIDLMHPVYKALADVSRYLSGSHSTWNDHYGEELESLKTHIERSTAR